MIPACLKAYIDSKNVTPDTYDDGGISRYRAMCVDIIALDKFSSVPYQNMREKSIVDSVLARLDSGRLPSLAQEDQIMKMHKRKGPVAFCGHRKNKV